MVRTMPQSRFTHPGRLAAVALLLACWLSPRGARPQQGSSNEPVAIDPNLGVATLRLWPGQAPGAKGDAPEDVPTLTVFRPAHPNGTAIIVDPGGGYLHLAAAYEGRQPADLLTDAGVTAFVLKYRLGPRYLYPVPLEDARRAVRLVRSLAGQYGYSPDRIGMMGFSAGGHLTAMTGTAPEPGDPNATDPVDRQSSALNYMVLVYPWLNAMQPQVPTPGQPERLMINYCSVTHGLTQADCARLDKEYTPLNYVSHSTPPTIIFHATTDNTVPVTTSVAFYSAMQAVGADCALHIFAHGPHGFGMGNPEQAVAIWPELLLNWMRERGLLNPAQPNR